MAKGFWTKVDPGSLRKRVTFFKPGEVRDDFGQIAPGLIEVCSVRADFYPVRGQEFYEVRKIQGKVTHKCYCRCNKNLVDADSTWYLMHKEKMYSIESIVNAGNANMYYEIYCTEHIDKESVHYERFDGDS